MKTRSPPQPSAVCPKSFFLSHSLDSLAKRTLFRAQVLQKNLKLESLGTSGQSKTAKKCLVQPDRGVWCAQDDVPHRVGHTASTEKSV